jgi:hypothetical protein
MPNCALVGVLVVFATTPVRVMLIAATAAVSLTGTAAIPASAGHRVALAATAPGPVITLGQLDHRVLVEGIVAG